MKKSEPLKKRRGKAKTKSFKKSKDEKTITTLMCSSALIDTQLFHMTLFPWMWETHSSHFREILISCFIVCLAEDKAMDDLKLTKEEKGRNFTVCLYRQRFALFSQRAQQMLWLSYLSWNQSYCTWSSLSDFDNTYILNIQYTSLDFSHTLCFKPQK